MSPSLNLFDSSVHKQQEKKQKKQPKTVQAPQPRKHRRTNNKNQQCKLSFKKIIKLEKTTGRHQNINALHIKCLNNGRSAGKRGNERENPAETTTQNHSKKSNKKAHVLNSTKLVKKTINTGEKNTTQIHNIFWRFAAGASS